MRRRQAGELRPHLVEVTTTHGRCACGEEVPYDGMAEHITQAVGEFRRALAQHDREVKAAALREGADARGHAPSCYPDPDRDPYVGCACRLTFLYARADRIERGEEP